MIALTDGAGVGLGIEVGGGGGGGDFMVDEGTEVTMICSPRVIGIVERVPFVLGRAFGGYPYLTGVREQRLYGDRYATYSPARWAVSLSRRRRVL